MYFKAETSIVVGYYIPTVTIATGRAVNNPSITVTRTTIKSTITHVIYKILLVSNWCTK